MTNPHPLHLDPTLLRLVPALERSLQTNPHLRGCTLERNKLRANIEYARTLLLTQERHAATLPVQSERTRVQADLRGLRDRIKRLVLSLGELEKAAATGVEEEEEGEEEEEEEKEEEEEEEEKGVMEAYAPARRNVHADLEVEHNVSGGGGGNQNLARHFSLPQEDGLRSRRPQQASDAKKPSFATTTARDQLFATRSLSKNNDNTTDPSLSVHDTLLTHHRYEQEALTTSLVELARELKTSAQKLGAGLAGEKEDVLGRVSGALDTSARGMEAAQARMGRLRRMSEGQGWWGRMKLYAMIVGLWVACVGVVFIGPKLRF